MPILQLQTGVYRGARPTAAQLAEGDPEIETIVSLETGWYERLHPGVEPERVLVKRFGLKLLSVPMSPFLPPRERDVERVLDYLRDEALRPVLFHCREGLDRTGVVAACYRRRVQGWGAQAAWNEMLRRGFHHRRYAYWLPAIRRLLK